MNLRALIALIFLSTSVISVAEVRWVESSLWRSAKVLPQGQHRWSARIGEHFVKSRFDGLGSEISLGQQYSQKWTWGELVSAQRNKSAQNELTEYMKKNNISNSDVAATSGFDIQRNETQFDVSWAYGMTSRWMFGLHLPVSYVTTKVSSEVDVYGDASPAFQSSLTGKSNVKTIVNEMVRSDLENQGFREVAKERSQWVWGDVSLLNQYLVYSSPDLRWSFQQVLRMPTSRNPSLSDFAVASRDTGQIDVGLTQFLEKSFGAMTGILGVGYVNQLPGPMRVSGYQLDSEAESADREIQRNLGDVWWGGVESRYAAKSWLRLSGAYRYFKKGEDKYKQISTFPGESSEGHVGRIVASYVFTPVERRFEIEKKWILNLQLQSTFAGANVDRSSSAMLELQTYF